MEMAKLVFDDYNNGTLPFTAGTISLSSFWTYIPRLLFEDKPFAYGYTWLVGYYFPGMAETGHTPSFGILTHEFVDFRWFAPVINLFLNPYKYFYILALLVIATKCRISKNFYIFSFCIILVPGFGFHLPFLFTFIMGYLILPLFYKKCKI